MIVEKVVGINCLQYLMSKTNLSYETIKIVSLHGRDKSILGAVSYSPCTFILKRGQHKGHTICQSLVEAGLGQVMVTIGENLSLEDERIIAGTAEDLSKFIFSDLTVLLIENPQYVNKDINFNDEDFKRDSVAITKENIRLITLGKLQIKPKDIIWDIGTGTGSMAIEMAKSL
ncbi:bifunctional cobalt-precorrin-7 (C(5))-methyltransferase CbiE/decarboxylating cobalt-precorrin-6B (C(15))-methyltransferase CbiT [endosymbiont 'TC1' of Trimyema compressum]|uniref:bifunctional cobalt-precorrin-7 (C(5))-methyltransferase CbiE/decarboxylating cobalt-precorrin-6B (C(15))-methyltransferase CbiT n=1 Tax=endosymbiont 'TC1' of Trimyema compressum TaxID=243899 RepID=UPI0013923AD4|nr:bifunctional cobalt-precorrin-7 (C(5))-methyltransferase CbiE/decarboxylating cobalt-precorrin-6B (C(15))-methyltransferase CbiT [endosymbiont 'TC1' of Trimyema compressum]